MIGQHLAIILIKTENIEQPVRQLEKVCYNIKRPITKLMLWNYFVHVWFYDFQVRFAETLLGVKVKFYFLRIVEFNLKLLKAMQLKISRHSRTKILS